MLKFTRQALFATLMIALSCSAISCSDDDKDEEGKEPEKPKPTVKMIPTQVLKTRDNGKTYPSDYTYNEKNQLIKYTLVWGDNESNVLKITFEYDDKDRVILATENGYTNYEVTYDEKGTPSMKNSIINDKGLITAELEDGVISSNFFHDENNNFIKSEYYVKGGTIRTTTYKYYTDILSPNLYLNIPPFVIGSSELAFFETGLHFTKSIEDTDGYKTTNTILESKDGYPTKVKEENFDKDGNLEETTNYTITYKVID